MSILKKYSFLSLLQLFFSLKFVLIKADFLQLTFTTTSLLITGTLGNSVLNRVHCNWEGNYFHWYPLDPELEMTFRYTWWHGLSSKGEIKKVFPTNRQQAPDLLDQVTSGYVVLHDVTCPEVTWGNVILCYPGRTVLLFIKQPWEGSSAVVMKHFHATFAKK